MTYCCWPDLYGVTTVSMLTSVTPKRPSKQQKTPGQHAQLPWRWPPGPEVVPPPWKKEEEKVVRLQRSRWGRWPTTEVAAGGATTEVDEGRSTDGGDQGEGNPLTEESPHPLSSEWTRQGVGDIGGLGVCG